MRSDWRKEPDIKPSFVALCQQAKKLKWMIGRDWAIEELDELISNWTYGDFTQKSTDLGVIAVRTIDDPNSPDYKLLSEITYLYELRAKDRAWYKFAV